jgi:hypothetical protein
MSKSEVKITSIFVGAAVVLSLVTWFTKPTLSVATAKGMIGQTLFKDFTDALAATSLEIVKFDEETGIPATFKVAQVNGLWAIPSHSDYPADAKDRIAEVASGLMDLEVLSVVAGTDEETAGKNIKELHEQLGVVDPGQKDLGGATGVGMRVTMQDKAGKDLLSLVVGKKVPDRDQLRYVRRVGQDPVYTVKVDTGKLSTKFEDWIEKDLLKLNSWDIKRVAVDEHSIDIIAQRVLQGGRITLEYDDTGDAKWKVLKDQVYQKGKWVDRELSENEELDADKLNGLKTAVDDLKIVDVARKPEGLSADLRAGGIQADQQTAQSLASRGFYFVEIPDASGEQRVELRSNEGECSILMKDGVRYVLRFGSVTDVASSGDEEKDEKEKPKEDESAEGEKEAASTSSDTGRYLFVMVQFDPSPIEEPKLEELPQAEKPADAEKADAEKTDAEKADAEKADAEKADAEKADAEKAQAEKEAEKPEEKAAEGDKPAEDAKDKEAELAKERERVEKENKRKQDEYDEKIAAGKKKVEELNARFADWYYVISDEVYKKIDLGRADMVKEKKKEETEKEGTAGTTEAAPAAPAKPAGPENPLREFDELKEDAPGAKE